MKLIVKEVQDELRSDSTLRAFETRLQISALFYQSKPVNIHLIANYTAAALEFVFLFDPSHPIHLIFYSI